MPNADLLDLALGRDSLCTQIMLSSVNLAMIRIGDLYLCMCRIHIVCDGLGCILSSDGGDYEDEQPAPPAELVWGKLRSFKITWKLVSFLASGSISWRVKEALEMVLNH